MQTIDPIEVQRFLDLWKNKEIYVYLEMTTGAYASLRDQKSVTASTFIKNGKVQYSIGSITGDGPYRVGLKIEDGWIYSQGLTHWDAVNREQLILAGHDDAGRLIVSLQLSTKPF